ncbi:helix-turn-helix domain-containing protein [Thiohalocapsa marina]|uniref:Helix-turn-helix domain-containing protein n=1 Tax=Thiohalocapsa marina TaxID=424902 RepID=A0A5M8FJF1_9GAMM|nr:RodZ domain-containing protein [Thiohalocapsa marina]KAA6183311.1 helix-turn-helix domain-containing protein [Thiohalocapsa marina]
MSSPNPPSDIASTLSDEPSAPAPNASEGPGATLARARAARRLSVVRIATELRLTPEVVEALEHDDYARLPSPVFVAGYLRSYARLLDLDPQPIVTRFHQRHPDAEPPLPRVVAEVKGQMKPRSGTPWLLALLLALVAGGGYIWWSGYQRSGPPEAFWADAPATGPAGTADEDAAAARPVPSPPALSTEPGHASSTDTSQEPPKSPATRATVDATGIGANGDGAGSPSLGSRTSEIETGGRTGSVTGTDTSGTTTAGPFPSVTATGSDTNRDSGDPAEQVPGESAGRGAGTAASAAVIDDGQRVEIAFSGPCWVDIRDASGEVQLFGEMADGDREILGGEPPYSLVIGNAVATEIRVGGQPFDVNAVARGNVARFELDPQQLPLPAANAPTTD